jgi:hypothetical protein
MTLNHFSVFPPFLEGLQLLDVLVVLIVLKQVLANNGILRNMTPSVVASISKRVF